MGGTREVSHDVASQSVLWSSLGRDGPVDSVGAVVRAAVAEVEVGGSEAAWARAAMVHCLLDGDGGGVVVVGPRCSCSSGRLPRHLSSSPTTVWLIDGDVG